MADKNKVGDYYTRPTKLGKWDGFKQFLWNGETSECLGRTGGSWGKSLKSFDSGFFREILKALRNAREEKKEEKTWRILSVPHRGKIDWKIFTLAELK